MKDFLTVIVVMLTMMLLAALMMLGIWGLTWLPMPDAKAKPPQDCPACPVCPSPTPTPTPTPTPSPSPTPTCAPALIPPPL